MGESYEWKDETLTTLRDESVVLETVLLDQTNEGDFLIYLMKAESFDKSRQAVKNSAHEIDKVHQQFKLETWEDGKKLELLIDLENFFKIK